MGSGFGFLMKAPLLPSHYGFVFVFGCRISFLVGSSLFLLMVCSAVSCDFGVFVRGGELKSFYSAILSLHPPVNNNFFKYREFVTTFDHIKFIYKIIYDI